jgi:hypothetical protein
MMLSFMAPPNFDDQLPDKREPIAYRWSRRSPNTVNPTSLSGFALSQKLTAAVQKNAN